MILHNINIFDIVILINAYHTHVSIFGQIDLTQILNKLDVYDIGVIICLENSKTINSDNCFQGQTIQLHYTTIYFS